MDIRVLSEKIIPNFLASPPENPLEKLQTKLQYLEDHDQVLINVNQDWESRCWTVQYLVDIDTLVLDNDYHIIYSNDGRVVYAE